MKPFKDDKRIGLETESHESGIVDPEKEKLAAQHSVPGQGDPSIRRKDPDMGSVITPPLSEQEDRFKGEDRTSAEGGGTTATSEENVVLHTSGGEMPDVPASPAEKTPETSEPGEISAKGNTQLPEEKKRKKAA